MLNHMVSGERWVIFIVLPVDEQSITQIDHPYQSTRPIACKSSSCGVGNVPCENPN